MKKRKTKRKTKQQKVIDETFEHVYSLLTTAQRKEIIYGPAEFRFPIHHKLLDMIPMVETVLNGNGFTQTDEVIQQIKKVAEKVAPASDVAAYS